jgi:hypothetical protein
MVRDLSIFGAIRFATGIGKDEGIDGDVDEGIVVGIDSGIIVAGEVNGLVGVIGGMGARGIMVDIVEGFSRFDAGTSFVGGSEGTSALSDGTIASDWMMSTDFTLIE